MPRKWRRVFLFSALGVLFIFGGIAQAQGNLLRDGGFEGQGYKNVASGDGAASFNVPQDWNGWLAQSPRTESWMNLVPNGFPHTAGFKREGGRSLSIGRGSATFTVAIYQQVTVTNGSNLRATAWAFLENVSQSNSRVRIGIDPTGGTNPLSGGIIWSGFYTTVQGWVQMAVDATAAAETITVFLYATQTWPNDPNAVYFDDAALVVGGGGGTAPQTTPGAGGVVPAPTSPPPPPAVVPFVSAQGAQPDGSIVHTVQAGDTIDSIAVAYGVTRSEIMELNNIASGSFIQIGQRLTIKPAPAAPTSEPTDEPPPATRETDNTATTPEAPTAQPTVEVQGAIVTEEPGSPTEESQTAASAPTEQPPPTEIPPQPVNPTEAPPAPVVAAAPGRVDPSSTVAAVCVLLFEDRNANRIQETGEALLAGGRMRLTADGEEIATYETDGAGEPHCFTDLAAGDYIVVASAPDGYGLTTPDQLRLRVQPGINLDVAFGAAQGIQPVAPPPADAGTTIDQPTTNEPEAPSTTDQLLRISGLIVFGLAGLVLLGGLGMTLFLRRR